MVGYVIGGILLLLLAAALIRRRLDMSRLDKLSGKMEDYLTGHGGRLPLSLKEDRIGDFLRLVIESGRSSYMYLQNVFADNRDQSLSLALCLAELLLQKDGAWRIHGGGFAGTTLNFVPIAQSGEFVETMERAFGKGACKVLNIRPVGAARLDLEV